MKLNKVISDQFNKWSDIDERQIHRCNSQKKKNTFAKTTSSRFHSQRILNRALQALRQAGLQVCAIAGSWTQILFVRQQVRPKARDGLRASELPRKGQRISGQLPQDKNDPARALRDQPRAITTARKALARAPPCLRGLRDGYGLVRCPTDSHCFGQYARRSGPIFGRGGKS
jgi:hypothetical protein